MVRQPEGAGTNPCQGIESPPRDPHDTPSDPGDVCRAGKKLALYRVRIDGLMAELRSRREALGKILMEGKEPEIPQGQGEFPEWEQSIPESVSEK